jgi:inorganic triphosphatase YgiF
MRNADDLEIEAKLLIVSQTPRRVVAALESLGHIAAYKLRPCPSTTLRDIYLDLPDGTLRQRGYALRLRHGGSRWLLALKGRARPVPGGGVERVEIEGSADDPNLSARIDTALGGIEAWKRLRDLGSEPLATLLDAGFGTIQERVTHRRSRDVLGTDGAVLAHLAIDSVTYRVQERDVRHHEVEVETAKGGDPAHLGRITRALAAAFESELRPCTHSKLAIGLGLQSLAESTKLFGDHAKSRSLEPVIGVNDEGDMTTQAYALLLEHLARRAP